MGDFVRVARSMEPYASYVRRVELKPGLEGSKGREGLGRGRCGTLRPWVPVEYSGPFTAAPPLIPTPRASLDSRAAVEWWTGVRERERKRVSPSSWRSPGSPPLYPALATRLTRPRPRYAGPGEDSRTASYRRVIRHPHRCPTAKPPRTSTRDLPSQISFYSLTLTYLIHFSQFLLIPPDIWHFILCRYTFI